MKIAQHAQGGVAGAEIIQCDTDPHLLQMMQDAECQLLVHDKRRLGDLKLQQADRIGGTHQDLADFFDKATMTQLHRRDIDRNFSVETLFQRFVTHLLQHPVA